MHAYLHILEYIVVHVFYSLNAIAYNTIYLYTTYKICIYIIHIMHISVYIRIIYTYNMYVQYTFEHTIALITCTFNAVAYKSFSQFEISVCSQY